MKKHRFGNNPFTVTSMGLGLAALGRPGYLNLGHADDLRGDYDVEAMERQAHAVLDEAWTAGIRYFDTARSYGRAEAFLASWLTQRGIDAGSVTVGSKWGYTYTADWQVALPGNQQHEVKDHSLSVLQRQIGESRGLLGDKLLLYQIHSATLDSGVLSNQAVLAELARLRDGGLAIGLSVSGEQQAETIWRALEVTFDGVPLFTSVQATWNLLEQSATPALRAAHEANLGVIVKEALANGRLTSRNASPAFARQISLLTGVASEYQVAIDALALAAVIRQPFVDVTLSGAATVAHLQSNLQALSVDWDAVPANFLAEFSESAADYWQQRGRLTWN